MVVGGHFSKWRPRVTLSGFEMSTLVIFIGKALFYQNQVRHAVLWEGVVSGSLDRWSIHKTLTARPSSEISLSIVLAAPGE